MSSYRPGSSVGGDKTIMRSTIFLRFPVPFPRRDKESEGVGGVLINDACRACSCVRAP